MGGKSCSSNEKNLAGGLPFSLQSRLKSNIMLGSIEIAMHQ
jgi:hypothetical protein